MKSIYVGVGISALIFALFSLNASASTVVYQQTPTQPATAGAPSSVWNYNGGGFSWASDADTQAWTSFTATSNLSFNQFTWYGLGALYTGGTLPPLNTLPWAVAITPSSYVNTLVQADGTIAGNLLPQSPYAPSQVTIAQVANNLFSFTVDLSSTVTLNSGQPYGVSVVSNNGSPTIVGTFQWAYSNSAIGNGTPGSPLTPNLAFTLTNTNPASPVPVPPAYALLLAGLGIIGIMVPRHRKPHVNRLAFA